MARIRAPSFSALVLPHERPYLMGESSEEVVRKPKPREWRVDK